MKRCPECRRDYYDDSLLYCLDDGSALVDGPGNQPLTSILPSEAPTRAIQLEPKDTYKDRGDRFDASKGVRSKAHRSYLLLLGVALAGVVGYGGFWFARQPDHPIDSIAVLPFQNADGNPDSEYISDGIAEALINSLTELRQLRVVARSTAFRYKGKEIDPQAAGRELNVRAVLTGRVRQTADDINIQVDLIDSSTGSQLWGQEYRRKTTDLLAVKQAIAREITERLRLRLSGDDQRRIVGRDSTNAEAFQSYLRGRYFWNKRSSDGLTKAIAEFQRSVEQDPDFALGYVGLADSYVVVEQVSGAPPKENIQKARIAADRALKLDDMLAEAHTSSAAQVYFNQWRWAEAENEFKRAIALNPNYPTAHHWFGMYLNVRRRFAEAQAEMLRAHELDPLSLIISANVAYNHTLGDRPDLGIEQAKRVIELDPTFSDGHRNLGYAFLSQRKFDEAIAAYERAAEVSGRASRLLGELGYCYAIAGQTARARAVLKELQQKYETGEGTGQYVASVLAGLGEKDEAFSWLNKDVERQSGVLPNASYRYFFDGLRDDPRYTDLMRRIGLDPS